MELNKINSTGNWGSVAEDINQNFSKVNNAVEQVKNATTRNKGYYATEADLKSAFTTANVGDIAYVGNAYPYQTWTWNGTGWVKKNNSGGDEQVNLGNYYTKDETDGKFDEADEKLSELGSYVENPEYARAYTDAEGHFLWGIRHDGSIEFAKGVPTPIKNYIDSLDRNNDEEVERINQLVIGLLDDMKVLTDTYHYVSNAEWACAIVDSEERILMGIKSDGTFYIPNRELYHIESNPEYTNVIIDSAGHVLFGIKKDGGIFFGEGVPQQVKDYVNTTFTNKVNNIYYKNRDKLNALANACRLNKFTQTSKDFQFLIVADHHAEDKALKNAIEAVNDFNAIDCLIHTGDIEAETYDVTYAKKFVDTLKTCKKPYLITVGNHDVGNSMFVYYGATHIDIYNSFVKPMVDAGILIGDGVSADSEYHTNIPYYYHDFKDRKVRVIVIYEYECPLDSNNAIKVEKVNPNDATEPDWAEYWEPTESYIADLPKIAIGQTYIYDENNPQYFNCGNFTGCSFLLKKTVTVRGGQYSDVIIDAGDVRNNTMPVFKCGRSERVIMKDQAEWLIDVLKSTPNGYGIVISTHNPSIMDGTNQPELKFATDETVNSGQCSQLAMSTDLIAEIVNAFIRKESLELKVVMSDSNINWHGSTAAYLNSSHEDGTYCYKLNIDFTKRNNNDAYFGCFVGGHVHRDLIFKHNKYGGIYAINPISANTQPGSMVASADIARPYNSDDVSYDSLTVVSVFGEYKTSSNVRRLESRIALTKLGNNKTINGENRDFEVIKNNYQV